MGKIKDIWRRDVPPAKDVDAFIKQSPKQTQAKLKELRKIIKGIVPKAEEVISYKMPVYKLNGKGLAGFAGFKSHIGFYPMSGSFLTAFKEELKDYETSKGAVQFPLARPLPTALIKKLLKERARQIIAATGGA